MSDPSQPMLKLRETGLSWARHRRKRIWPSHGHRAGLGLAAVCGLILLAGCTTWVRPGATDAMRDAAETHCQAASYTTLPANVVTRNATGGPTYADRGKCEKNNYGATCTKVNGRYTPVRQIVSDSNSEGRDAIFRDCMLSSGWSEQ